MTPTGFAALLVLLFLPCASLAAGSTAVSLVGEEFHVNGEPTYKGRTWQGRNLQGLLLNSRMVQGIFDDRNPATITN